VQFHLEQMTSCALTVNEQKQAVIALVGGVNAEVRQLLVKHIDQIWCAALQHSCEYPLTFLYAQREAIDFALAKLAPLVNQKRGKTDAFRTAEGFTRSKSEAKTTQRGSGFSCDWSNTGSYASHQNNSDSWTINRSASDSSAQSFYYSHTWDRGRVRDDAQSRSTYERRAGSTRRTESQDFSNSVTNSDSYERTNGMQSVPYIPLGSQIIPVKVAIPPFDISWDTGTFLGTINLTRGPEVGPDVRVEFNQAAAPCDRLSVSCPLTISNSDLVACGITDDDTPIDISICALQSYSANSELFSQITIPIPFLGSFTFAGTWAKNYESRPRCGRSTSIALSTGFSSAVTWMRGNVRGDGSSRSESQGTRQNDAHTRATGSSTSSSFARSVGDAYTISIGESHSGSDTNSHGESQSQDLGNSRSQSRGVGLHKTTSDREHEFDIRMYSDAFKALNDLRLKVVEQIEEVLNAIGRQLYTKGKVRDTQKKCDINVYQLGRGQVSDNAICCTPMRSARRISKTCYVNSMA